MVTGWRLHLGLWFPGGRLRWHRQALASFSCTAVGVAFCFIALRTKSQQPLPSATAVAFRCPGLFFCSFCLAASVIFLIFARRRSACEGAAGAVAAFCFFSASFRLNVQAYFFLAAEAPVASHGMESTAAMLALFEGSVSGWHSSGLQDDNVAQLLTKNQYKVPGWRCFEPQSKMIMLLNCL